MTKGASFLTVKNDTVDKVCKICNEKNKFALKRFTLYLYTNIRNSIAHHNTESRLVSLPKCVIFKFCGIFEERLVQPDATGIKYQVFSIHKYINAKCFLLNKKCGFLKYFSSTVIHTFGQQYEHLGNTNEKALKIQKYNQN